MQKFEIVNNKDKSRLSHPVKLTSTTLFDTEIEAKAWMGSRKISPAEYSVVPVEETE